jgi:hypothetical protein
MKCDGLPDPVCVRQLNTYLSLWVEDNRETIDPVLERTLEVLPIMSTLENLIENPDEWEVPIQEERESRSYKSKIQARNSYYGFSNTGGRGHRNTLSICGFAYSLFSKNISSNFLALSWTFYLGKLKLNHHWQS